MATPVPQDQVQFLLNIQRLLTEGQFTATYKYALLLSLADLAVELGDDSGDELHLQASQLAEKFIEYYWRQSVPFSGIGASQILKQNFDRQAAVVRLIAETRESKGDNLAAFKRNGNAWRRLVAAVARVICVMPLWKLQIVGRSTFDFLYENRGTGTTITLRPGVAFCLRRFYELITDVVRGAWVHYIREQNAPVLGAHTDLNEFLFGSERGDLSGVREILVEVQSNECFYCAAPLRTASHVDHFIPWTVYPVDLGHNFVLAHDTCTLPKAAGWPLANTWNGAPPERRSRK